jgi:Uma2 family endonuclease
MSTPSRPAFEPSDVSFAAFVAWEQQQTERHELVAGTVIPFLAGSADHELITGNVFARLHASIEPPCRVFPSTTIVKTVTRAGQDGFRPDVTVCSEANIGSREFIEEPRIVVEVVSPSNRGLKWDRKLFEYWNTPSIEQLVFISSQERALTSHCRDVQGLWTAAIILEGDGVLVFPSVDVTITLTKIYQNTSLA